MKISTFFRTLFTLALLVGVYSETGIWTTIFAAQVSLFAELFGYALRKNALQLDRTRLFKQWR